MIHFTVFQKADRTSYYVGTYLAPSIDRVTDHIQRVNSDYGMEATRKHYPQGIERMELTIKHPNGDKACFCILPTDITVLNGPYEEPANV